MINNREKILGALFGIAIGDALGSVLEDSSHDDAEIEHGYLTNFASGGIFKLEKGEVTENTHMALNTLKGITRQEGDIAKSIEKCYGEWFSSNPRSMGDFLRFIMGTFSSFSEIEKAKKMVSQYLDEMEYSRGFLPRALIPSICFKDMDIALNVSKEQALITNGNEEAITCAMNLSKIGYKLFNGMNKIGMIDLLYEYPEYSIKELLKSRKKDLIVRGNMIEDLKTAFWCFISFESVEEIICEAANLYGNSGTIASLAGGISGIYYGISNFPQKWIDGLPIKDEIFALGEEVLSTMMK